jgi:hypothetical protein
VPSFSVDTKLFQELGELLVAKESTALVELIKNAYDADATEVAVTGTNLGDAKSGSIIVADDGSGMTREEFELGFLRIAGRTKLTGDRRSLVFGRRYTGEKGVGRLAAHKLATRLEILSSKGAPGVRDGAQLRPPISSVRATIDWNEIESLETLGRAPCNVGHTDRSLAASPCMDGPDAERLYPGGCYLGPSGSALAEVT